MNMLDPEMVIDPEEDRMEDGNPDDLNGAFLYGHSEDATTINVSVSYLDLAKLEGEFNTPALLYRLLHMLEVCNNKKPEISKKILQSFHNSYDVEFIRKYNTLVVNEIDCNSFLNSILTNAENSSISSIEAAQAELKRWQDSGVKESIRTAMVQLFDAYFSSGRFADATKLYSKSIRDFASSPRSVIPMLLDQIKGLMFMKDYSRVEIFLAQTERAVADCQQRESIANMEMNRSQSSSMYPRDDKLQKATMRLSQSATAKIGAVYGVVKMAHKQYKQAAEKFVQIDHEVFEYPELLATIDIAYYGCFCALATFDRQQLLDKVLNNGNFRKFMEPEGKLVDLIQAFRNNSFVTVFELLEQLRPALLLNLYISRHVDNIYRLIRRRAFIQYTATFGVIDLPTMAKVFRTNPMELIDELVDMIDNDLLSARVDPISMKLYKPRPNKTKQQSERISTLQSNMEHRINAVLIRASLYLNGINVTKEQTEDDTSYPPGAKRGRRTAPGFHDFEDYDEDNYYPDDHEMISQTQQLSFYNQGPAGRGLVQRLIGRLGSGSSREVRQLRAAIPTLEVRNPVMQEELDQTQSDIDMADP